MKCYANQIDGGLCVSRQGKVLSQENFDNIHSLPDKDVCKWKQHKSCICSGKIQHKIKPDLKETDKEAFDSFFK